MATLHERINPAERRLNKLDLLDLELERELTNGTISREAYRENKQILTISRNRAYEAWCRARGVPAYLPEPVDTYRATPEPDSPAPRATKPGPEEPKPSIKVRLLGFVVLLIWLGVLVRLMLLFGSRG